MASSCLPPTGCYFLRSDIWIPSTDAPTIDHDLVVDLSASSSYPEGVLFYLHNDTFAQVSSISIGGNVVLEILSSSIIATNGLTFAEQSTLLLSRATVLGNVVILDASMFVANSFAHVVGNLTFDDPSALLSLSSYSHLDIAGNVVLDANCLVDIEVLLPTRAALQIGGGLYIIQARLKYAVEEVPIVDQPTVDYTLAFTDYDVTGQFSEFNSVPSTSPVRSYTTTLSYFGRQTGTPGLRNVTLSVSLTEPLHYHNNWMMAVVAVFGITLCASLAIGAAVKNTIRRKLHKNNYTKMINERMNEY